MSNKYKVTGFILTYAPLSQKKNLTYAPLVYINKLFLKNLWKNEKVAKLFLQIYFNSHKNFLRMNDTH